VTQTGRHHILMASLSCHLTSATWSYRHLASAICNQLFLSSRLADVRLRVDIMFTVIIVIISV